MVGWRIWGIMASRCCWVLSAEPRLIHQRIGQRMRRRHMYMDGADPCRERIKTSLNLKQNVSHVSGRIIRIIPLNRYIRDT